MHTPYDYLPRTTDIHLDDFAALCERTLTRDEAPLCADIIDNVPLYQAETLLAADRRTLTNALHGVLKDGPGVLVVRGGYPDHGVIDRHSQVFQRIFDQEKATGVAADHFAKAGSNGRIWNALQKAALLSPESFAEYYANPLIGLIATAWLGAGFQMTAQVNVVYPGGAAQQPHCDYHLGFQTNEVVETFPLPLHALSQHLTLQGAIAHTDMPLETGPTLLLPFSQRYRYGYLAWRREEFAQYFHQHAVQVPLQKGDMLFFNPGLFHAAGSNVTADKARIANLLQISIAFGKPMEELDRDAMMCAVYPQLLRQVEYSKITPERLAAVIACLADGYAFPTNLDRDPPRGGLAPRTAQDLIRLAISERWPSNVFNAEVEVLRQKRQAKRQRADVELLPPSEVNGDVTYVFK